MNKVILCGRLTKDPDVRYSKGEKATAIARYSLAIDRYGDGADFPSCVAFGKQGEFAEKHLHKGMKILVEGHIQTGSYKNKDGQTVYTTDVIVDRHEFVEKKSANESANEAGTEAPADFYNVNDAMMDGLPFN